ncbi:MAG: hypothetical protein JNK02_17495 [Planctomycetes bacterium]|nr:hypothetical protein [Planctomycetota bacterium]
MGVTRHPLFDDGGRLSAVPPDRAVIRRLRASLTRALAAPDCFVAHFHRLLFDRRPDLRALFPTEVTQLACRVRGVLAWCVARLWEPAALELELARLGRQHHALGVAHGDYAVAVECLLAALRASNGDAWEDAVERDWRELLTALTAAMWQARGPVG